MTNQTKQTQTFETEVSQILHLVIHSLYSNKEIFLRELISNASDANDKLRFEAMSNNALYEGHGELAINIDINKDARTLTIRDNGIGMTRDEVIEFLGTIAKSGTKEFFKNLTGDQAKDSALIGQFGVGFYSAFIVADKVTVKTRKAGSAIGEGVIWTSNGESSYEIENAALPKRGTEITLHIKEGLDEYLSDYRIQNIIKKYSDHISWPIKMMETETIKEGEGNNATEKEVRTEKVINRATALWTRSRNELTDDDYKEFYKHISHDFKEPLEWMHNRVEGKQEYTTLLYIPKAAPFDLFQQEHKHGLKLFVKRVFILDDADQFLPRYLRFIKGIVDANDLPLNVSREILQDNKAVENIKNAITKRVLTTLETMADNEPEKYAEFWKEFGLVLKEGTIEDYANKEKVAKLLRFSSTHEDKATPDVSFDAYISRMAEGAEKIYYITAESFNAAKNSPHLEIFRKKGIEVLLLTDRIDEWLVNHLSEYTGKHLQSVTKGELDIDTPEENQAEDKKAKEEEFKSVIEQMKKVLGDKVKDVRTTNRLTSSPACLVADAYDMNREMLRILKAAGQEAPEAKPIMEVNMEHPLLTRLQHESDDDKFAIWTEILFEQSILAEGGHLNDPASFVNKMNKAFLELAR